MGSGDLVLKGCMIFFALSLTLQYVVRGWFSLKGRGGSGKICYHRWGSAFNVKETVSSGGVKLLGVVVVVMSLLLIVAGDVETSPAPQKKVGAGTT